MTTKQAQTDHPVHELIAQRWSPYGFDSRPVPADDIRSLFEAARWAPSSYNEQPWSYIIATQESKDEFDTLASCLVEANQAWAQKASVLALAVVKLHFDRNDKPNAAAEHDMGLAAGNLALEATARGLFVHQMIGINPDRAREVYGIPDGYKALTALAIGHRAPLDAMDENLRTRDESPRQRKPLAEFVYSGKWSNPADLVR